MFRNMTKIRHKPKENQSEKVVFSQAGFDLKTKPKNYSLWSKPPSLKAPSVCAAIIKKQEKWTKSGGFTIIDQKKKRKCAVLNTLITKTRTPTEDCPGLTHSSRENTTRSIAI